MLCFSSLLNWIFQYAPLALQQQSFSKLFPEPYEGSVERPDLRALRYQLIEEVTNLSRLMPLDNQTEQWNSLATERIYAFFGQVIEDNKVEAFIEANRGDKVWTIWNSVVFCATIYTTIGKLPLVDFKMVNNSVIGENSGLTSLYSSKVR